MSVVEIDYLSSIMANKLLTLDQLEILVNEMHEWCVANLYTDTWAFLLPIMVSDSVNDRMHRSKLVLTQAEDASAFKLRFGI